MSFRRYFRRPAKLRLVELLEPLFPFLRTRFLTLDVLDPELTDAILFHCLAQRHPNLNLTPEEKRVFYQLFQAADTTNLGVITGEIAVPFFEKTKLPSGILGEVCGLRLGSLGCCD